MAIVRVEIFKRDQATREAIIQGITDVLVANGAKSEGTQVILYELEPEVWGKGGQSFAKRLAGRTMPDGRVLGADATDGTAGGDADS
jgi:phenylpyruvate tautomerase PptA (4-oxalocrotonate tautomerase family)